MKLSKGHREEQEGNPSKKQERKKRRGIKCREANPLSKCPLDKTLEQGHPREAPLLPIPVNNAYSLLEL
jgi:hypothetical protein